MSAGSQVKSLCTAIELKLCKPSDPKPWMPRAEVMKHDFFNKIDFAARLSLWRLAAVCVYGFMGLYG